MKIVIPYSTPVDFGKTVEYLTAIDNMTEVVIEANITIYQLFSRLWIASYFILKVLFLWIFFIFEVG